MKTFTIENGTHHITLHASVKDAEAVPDAERFANQAALAKLAANWSAARLVEIWNHLPDATPVQKFKNRKTAVSRIWNALQSAGQPALATPATPHAPPTPDVAPEQPPAKHTATRKKKARVAAPAKKPSREGSKTETIVALMKHPGGTTLQAIMEATGWQAHSVRGFISGTLGKKMGLTVASTKGENGERSYSIQA